MTEAETLCKAAHVLRKAAEGATVGPWVPFDMSDKEFDSEDGKGWWWVWQKTDSPYYRGVFAVDQKPDFYKGGFVAEAAITDHDRGLQEKADATYVSLMHPLVGLALADSLEATADMAENNDGTWRFDLALRVAEAILEGFVD